MEYRIGACLICGNEIKVKSNQTEHKLKYCSWQCSGIGRTKHKTERERILANRASRRRYWLKNKDKWLKYSTDSYRRKKKRLGLKSNTSKDEMFVYEQLKEQYPNSYIYRNYRKLLRSPKTGYPLELDFYIPSLKKAFEVNGICHRKPVRGGVKKLKERQRNDLIKKQACNKIGIELTVISV